MFCTSYNWQLCDVRILPDTIAKKLNEFPHIELFVYPSQHFFEPCTWLWYMNYLYDLTTVFTLWILWLWDVWLYGLLDWMTIREDTIDYHIWNVTLQIWFTLFRYDDSLHLLKFLPLWKHQPRTHMIIKSFLKPIIINP